MSNNKQTMKKLLITATLVGMMSSCNEATVEMKTTKIVTHEGANPLRLITIEGCEYFEYSLGHRYSLCHKGNCKNPIHKGGNK